MSFVIASLVCAQLVFPTSRTGLTLGSRQAQQYPASVGAIAWKADGGLGTIWLDGRRSLGQAAVGTRLDLWGAKLAIDASAPLLDPTGVLLVAGPSVGVLDSPGIAFNSGVAAIVWLERRPAMTAVHLALGNEDDASIFAAPWVLASAPGISSVSVAAAGTGFLITWSSGTQLTWTRVEAAGAPTVPVTTQVAGTQTVSRALIAGLSDGGAAFAYSSSPAPRAGFFTHDYTSPTSDAGLLFDISGSLSGIGLFSGTPSLLFRDASGELLSRTSTSSFNSITFTRPLSECVVAGTEALTAVAYVDASNASQLGFITSSAAVRVIEATRAEAVAVAASSTHGAYLRRVDGLSVVTRAVVSTSLEPQTELNLAQPTQRGPSVAWLPNAAGFVVAYEERVAPPIGAAQTWSGRLSLVRPDGGTVELNTTGAPQTFPVSPRVVEWDADSIGVEDQNLLTRSHRLYGTGTGLSPPDSITGLDWRSSARPPLLRWRESGVGQTSVLQAVGTISLPITSPRCATTVNGKHLLAGWSGSAILLYEVSGLTTNFTTISAPTNIAARGSVCITRGRSGAEALAAWSHGDSLRVLPIGSGAPQVTISGPTGTMAFENPVATRLGSGVLVVWEMPPAYSNIGAAFVDDANPTAPVMVALRTVGDLVRNPTVTSAPGGPAIIAWQEFDAAPGVGATRVRARLVFPPAPPDAGVDAGVLDAGTIDAGAGMIDAGGGGIVDAGGGGIVDAGGVDAGDFDGGDADAGQRPAPDAGDVTPTPAMLTFTPSCGCSGGPGALAFVLLALWARRRSPRTG